HSLVGAGDSGIEHVGNPVAGLRIELHAPNFLERTADFVVGYRPVSCELVRERAHVAGALHVVLTAQRVHPAAREADVAGGHRQVRHAHDHGRALAVFGDAEAVVDGAV